MFWQIKRPLFFYRNIIYLFFLIILSVCPNAFGEDWPEAKGAHFIVVYESTEDYSLANDVLTKSEEYYSKIADQIGYARYQDFWTWEDRAKIVICSDQNSYLEKTHQPSWSKGFAVRDQQVLHSRAIMTYKQEDGFLDNLLPHEICHLILRDFIGFDRNIPLWFNEGMAQLQEQGKRDEADKFMRIMVKQERQMPLRKLFTGDIRHEKNQAVIAVFYAQSISVIDFLVKNYGSSKFRELCRYLREGKDFEGALKASYISMIDSVEGLEKKWLSYMQN